MTQALLLSTGQRKGIQKRNAMQAMKEGKGLLRYAEETAYVMTAGQQHPAMCWIKYINEILHLFASVKRVST